MRSSHRLALPNVFGDGLNVFPVHGFAGLFEPPRIRSVKEPMNRLASTDVDYRPMLIINVFTERRATSLDGYLQMEGGYLEWYFGTVELDHAWSRLEIEPFTRRIG